LRCMMFLNCECPAMVSRFGDHGSPARRTRSAGAKDPVIAAL
jgi:hypothetical protein